MSCGPLQAVERVGAVAIVASHGPPLPPGDNAGPARTAAPDGPRLHDAPFDAAPAVLAGAEAGASLPDTLGR